MISHHCQLNDNEMSLLFIVMEGTFKNNLRDELNYQDITVKELASKTGIPKPTIDCYLSARHTMPPADIAVRIAKALNVSVEYLVTGKDEKIIPHDYISYQPYRFLLEDLSKLSDDEIKTLSTMIHALAEKK